jgi:hypothetical protein
MLARSLQSGLICLKTIKKGASMSTRRRLHASLLLKAERALLQLDAVDFS